MTITEPYSMIPNRITDSVLTGNFTKNEIKVIFFIARHTYGFHTEKQALSETFISKGTGIDKKSVKEVINKLIKRNIISVVTQYNSKTPRVLRINVDSLGGGEITPEGKTPPSQGGKTPPTPGGQITSQENKYINKTINKYIPPKSKRVCIDDGFDPDEFFRAALERQREKYGS